MKWLLFLLLASAGCVREVRVRSQPTPADVLLSSGKLKLTPFTVKVRRTPFKPQLAEVTAVGYRPLVIDLRRAGPQNDIFVLLVPEHGPSGSWTTDEVPGGGE